MFDAFVTILLALLVILVVACVFAIGCLLFVFGYAIVSAF